MSHLKKFAAAGMTLTMVVGLLPVTAMAAHYNEWVKKSDGYWYYYDGNGHKVKNESQYCADDYCFYLLNGKGQRVTAKGLTKTTKIYTNFGDAIKFSRSYYVQEGGALLTSSWKKISGKWYYFDFYGEMRKAETARKGYDENGNDKYYLLGNDGKMVTKKGWYKAKDTTVDIYSGKKLTDVCYYYVQSDGSVVRNGVKKIGGKYYAFYLEGAMVQNDTYTSRSGKVYLYGDSGARIKKTGWASVKVTQESTVYDARSVYTYKYYIDKDGSVHIGWKKIKGKWYYFDHHMYRNTKTTRIDSGKTYIFDKNGVCINHG